MKGNVKASVWEKHEAVGAKWKKKEDRKWISCTFYLVHYSTDLHKVFRLIDGKLVQVKEQKMILSCPQCKREKKEGKKDRQLSFFENK